MRSSKFFILSISLFALLFSSCGNGESNKEREQEEANTEAQQEQDLVSTIQGVTVLSRFAMELGAAEIPELKNEQSNYTFFAPVNGAFGPFYDEAGNRIVNISSSELLSYHMVPREYTIDQLEEQLEEANDSLSLATVQGEQIWITREDDKIMLQGKYGGKAEIMETLNASNGIVHIIDEVLLHVKVEEQEQNETN